MLPFLPLLLQQLLNCWLFRPHQRRDRAPWQRGLFFLLLLQFLLTSWQSIVPKYPGIHNLTSLLPLLWLGLPALYPEWVSRRVSMGLQIIFPGWLIGCMIFSVLCPLWQTASGWRLLLPLVGSWMSAVRLFSQLRRPSPFSSPLFWVTAGLCLYFLFLGLLWCVVEGWERRNTWLIDFAYRMDLLALNLFFTLAALVHALEKNVVLQIGAHKRIDTGR